MDEERPTDMEIMVRELTGWLNGEMENEPGREAIQSAIEAFEKFTGTDYAAIVAEFGLPESVRHGLVRYAALACRELTHADYPPAVVAALWRPWRRMNLV